MTWNKYQCYQFSTTGVCVPDESVSVEGLQALQKLIQFDLYDFNPFTAKPYNTYICKQFGSRSDAA